MSLINDTARRKKTTVAKITSKDELDKIKAYIQGAVYCWCKNNDGWFFAGDLFGGKNWDWTGTPIASLWAWHNKRRPKDAVDMAGKDAGVILKEVLKSDARIFTTEKAKRRGFPMSRYKWIK